VFLVTAHGIVVDNPRHHRKAERYLKRCQRRVSRRKKGSHRRRKAVVLLAKAHQHVQRQRADFHHKTALVRATDVIHHDDAHTATMLKRHHRAKPIQDASWSQFLCLLAY